MSFYNVFGHTSVPPASALSVQNSSAQSIPNGFAWTKVVLDTEDFDTQGAFTGNTFTPTKAGKYAVNVQAVITLSLDAVLQVAIYKNGSIYKNGITVYASSAGGAGASAFAIVNMNGTTDTLDFYVRHNSGTANDLASSDRKVSMDAHWIGA